LKVLGIDPGITATGYGIISRQETGEEKTCWGTIWPKKGPIYNKISQICLNIKQIIEEYEPEFAVLEKVFYQKNIQSLLRSSELRGAIILTLMDHKIKILEYAPAQIKLATTGNGRASKDQVRYFIERLLVKTKTSISNHAIDALAIAYTAYRKQKGYQNIR